MQKNSSSNSSSSSSTKNKNVPSESSNAASRRSESKLSGARLLANPRRLEEKQRTQRQASATREGKGAQRDPNIWFARKNYGWGWTPATWQGWAVVVAHLVLIFVWARVLLVGKAEDPRSFLIFFTIIIVQTALLIFISYKKGERPKWQWGGK